MSLNLETGYTYIFYSNYPYEFPILIDFRVFFSNKKYSPIVNVGYGNIYFKKEKFKKKSSFFKLVFGLNLTKGSFVFITYKMQKKSFLVQVFILLHEQ